MHEIVAVRLEPSRDQSHDHVSLIGYGSQHIPGEPIMIPIERVIERIAIGEKFFVTAGEERAEVTASTCEICGLEPYVKTTADRPGDAKLLGLPQQ